MISSLRKNPLPALRVVSAGEGQGVHLRVIGALAFWRGTLGVTFRF